VADEEDDVVFEEVADDVATLMLTETEAGKALLLQRESDKRDKMALSSSILDISSTSSSSSDGDSSKGALAVRRVPPRLVIGAEKDYIGE
jgi:hypothetical protein